MEALALKILFDALIKVCNFQPIHLARKTITNPLYTHDCEENQPKGKSVRVTFELPETLAATSVAVAGTFNEWDVTKHLMKLDTKKGVWTKSISFKPGETVEFRYFIDEGRWQNDEEADGFTATPFFSENSVLSL